MNWIVYFAIALLCAGLTLVFSKVALQGFSAGMLVAVEAVVLLIVRFTVLDFRGYISTAAGFSSGTWIRLIICAGVLAAGVLCFFVGASVTNIIAVAPFEMMVPVFTMLLAVIFDRNLPSLKYFIIMMILAAGILLMGFGRQHKVGWWWIPTIIAPLLVAVSHRLEDIYPSKIGNNYREVSYLLIILIISLIASIFMKRTSIKKITVYHLLFAVLAALAYHFAPICFDRALALSGFDTVLTIIYSLWIVVTLIGAAFMLKEKVSHVGITGLVFIAASVICRVIFL